MSLSGTIEPGKKYCQEETPEFRERMDNWLADITGLFRKSLGSNYVASVLMGGYGRGWGAMLPSEKGPLPVNDMDVALVTQRHIPAETVLQLHEKATQLVNPDSRYSMTDCSEMDFHVDVMNFAVTDFQRLTPTQFHYDLVHGSRLIDGENVLQSANGLTPEDLGAGDALRLVFNHIINLFEPIAAGIRGGEETTQGAFLTATKSGIASGAAITLVNKLYSSKPDERIRIVKALLASELGNSSVKMNDNYTETVQECTFARAQITPERLTKTPEFYTRAKRNLMDAARYLLVRSYDASWIEDPVQLADCVIDLWRTEDGPSGARQPLSPRRLAKLMLQAVGLKRKLPPWEPRARVYAAGLCALDALSVDENWSITIDGDSLNHAVRLLDSAGWHVQVDEASFSDWQMAGRTAVTALKRQNLIR